MTSINNITGDKIQSKGLNSNEYKDTWDRIFGKKEKEPCACGTWTAGCCTTEVKTKEEKSTGCCGECH